MIERGHVYIAQPPLYRVKIGKSERYVKDDEELESFLLELTGQNFRLDNSAQGTITGEALIDWLRGYKRSEGLIQRMGRRYDEDVARALRGLPTLDEPDFVNVPAVEAWAEQLRQVLAKLPEAGVQYDVQAHPAASGQPLEIVTTRMAHGSEYTVVWPQEFFESAEYARLVSTGQALAALWQDDTVIVRGERRIEADSAVEACILLDKEARRGLTVQRYKGLGEMNPGQLWETTLDPASRRLMQVRIEDAEGAQDIFTTLMGDEVEPRRDFIVANALHAVNVDI